MRFNRLHLGLQVPVNVFSALEASEMRKQDIRNLCAVFIENTGHDWQAIRKITTGQEVDPAVIAAANEYRLQSNLLISQIDTILADENMTEEEKVDMINDVVFE